LEEGGETMKKLIALMLMGAFLFAVAGCKKKTDEKPKDTKPAETKEGETK
jgi:hypothetical protein